MADQVMNVAKGKFRYYCELSAANDALIAVLIKTSGLVADDTLNNYLTLSALLAGASDEADFTNYVRKNITSATITQDDTNNRVDVDVADQTWTAAGGASNNPVSKVIWCFDPDTTTGTDADLVPLSHHDFVFTPDGSDVTLVVATAGLLRAA
jgi:hypothetical protein